MSTTSPVRPRPSKALGRAMKSAPTALSLTWSRRAKAAITGNTTKPAVKATPKSESATTVASRERFSFERR